MKFKAKVLCALIQLFFFFFVILFEVCSNWQGPYAFLSCMMTAKRLWYNNSIEPKPKISLKTFNTYFFKKTKQNKSMWQTLCITQGLGDKKDQQLLI